MTQECWTQKHRDFAIAHNLPQSAWSLWEYLVLEGYQGSEIIDLRDFNKWVERNRGKGYDRRTLKSAAQRLEEAGVLTLEKGGSFTAFVKKWVIKPLGVLLKPILRQDKRSKPRSPNATLESSNLHNAAPGVQAVAANLKDLPEDLMSDIEKNVELCEAAGINFDPEDIPQILDLDPEDVVSALALFHKRGGHDKISNAEGWMRRCLERRWWESKRPSFAEVLINLAKYLGVNR